ncbi:hypothetical protein V5O48_017929 [Marasmius crinis-equi]|uniref:acylaminoacyl-peptidase n=1 Tax=Marasmius crinis-equi TaxID=585013 RepID=A0ABR3EML6_9AGAR
MSSTVYERLVGLPVPISANFVDRNVIQLNSLARDFTSNTDRCVSKTLFISSNSTFSSPNQEIADTVLLKPSRSGLYRANLKEVGSDDKKRRFVEVWSKERLVVSKEVTKFHGAFYSDDYISTLSFSVAENAVVYVAEENDETSKDIPERFRYQQSYGEEFPAKKRPAPFVFMWDPKAPASEKSIVVRLSVTAPLVSFGQALFSSHPEVLFATGYEHISDGRLLGRQWCHNRPSGIWQITLEKDAFSKALAADNPPSTVDCKLVKLTPPGLSCRSPRIVSSEDSERLIWLACSTGGAHTSTSRLYSLDIRERVSPSDCRVLVDIVDVDGDDGMLAGENGAFPGLYPNTSLPHLPSVRIHDRDYLIIHSIFGSCSVVLRISLDDGTVTNLTPTTSNSLYSWTILNTDGDRQFVCVRSSQTVPYEVVLGKFDGAGNVLWRILQSSLAELPIDIQKQLSQLKVSIERVPNRHLVEIVVVEHTDTKDGKIPPHMLVPHGEPHITSTVRFDPAGTAYALQGFNLSFPNYTGSLGFGESNVQKLLGNSGNLDVEDCLESLRHLVRIGAAEAGPSKLFLLGGGHGGFIAGHLMSRYPNTFTAACLTNPVLSVGERSTSDIPDWYRAHLGHDHPLLSSPVESDGRSHNIQRTNDLGTLTPAVYQSLFNASPIAHVKKIKAAVLLVVGGSDKRVPPTQSIDFYHALKAARRKAGADEDGVDMMWFPDEGHGLGGVEASKMMWVRSVEWFRERLDTP